MTITDPRPPAARTRPAADDATPTDLASWYAARWEPSRRLATRLLGNPEDGADVAAAVLVDVWARWQVTGMPDTPDAYLNRAIRNRVASHFQRRDRERAAVQRFAAHAGRSPQVGPEDRAADRDAVDHLLARLPDDERRTVSLLYLSDLTCTETARELGIRPVSVRSRVHRSRRRLAAPTAA
jgi:RNA polymerase sigma-70 factor, ECF subfamily